MTHRRLALSAAIALAATLPACADYLDPEVGPPLPERCRDVDSDPENDVSFERQIKPLIFDVACVACHDPNAENPAGFRRSGLDLTSYDATFRGGINSQRTIVVLGQPCRSVLYEKVVDGPPFGKRMPSNGPPYLSDPDIQLIHDWIAEGARD